MSRRRTARGFWEIRGSVPSHEEGPAHSSIRGDDDPLNPQNPRECRVAAARAVTARTAVSVRVAELASMLASAYFRLPSTRRSKDPICLEILAPESAHHGVRRAS
jgi:hypothetical protein